MKKTKRCYRSSANNTLNIAKKYCLKDYNKPQITYISFYKFRVCWMLIGFCHTCRHNGDSSTYLSEKMLRTSGTGLSPPMQDIMLLDCLISIISLTSLQSAHNAIIYAQYCKIPSNRGIWCRGLAWHRRLNRRYNIIQKQGQVVPDLTPNGYESLNCKQSDKRRDGNTGINLMIC